MSEDRSVRLALTGSMDKDSDPRYVNQGNYRDAQNIQSLANEGGDGGSKAPTLGNEYGFDLGSVSAQRKRYRITVDGDATKTHSVRFFSTKRDANILTGTGSLGEIEFNGTAASFNSAFSTAVAASPTNWLSTTNGNSIEVEMTSYPYYQWYLDSVGTDDVTVTCIQEAIPVDLEGTLKDIGNYDLLGDLFVFSTTQDLLPQETDLVVTNVGLGDPTSITFSSEHGLTQGQWIRITNSEASWLNGLLLVNEVTSPTSITVITDSTWGVAHVAFTPESETITINPNGIGEIGVAINDENTDSWTYTRLLRSVELNFVSKRAIRSDARNKGNRKILYYTDKYNKPRDFVYRDAFVEDGALTFVNSSNQYQYDSINFQTDLLNNSISSIDTKIEYVGQSDSGGELLSGNKYYVFRFKDQEGSATIWSDPTRAIPVFPRSLVDDDPVTIKGGAPNSAATSKVVNLLLSGIPQGIFDSVEFGYLESDESGALSGFIFNDINLTDTQQSLSFSHNGREEDQLPLDIGEIAVSLGSYEAIKTVGDLAIIDKRLVMGNITYVDVSDLSEWALQFKHQIKYLPINGLSSITEETIGGYLDPQNVFKYPSVTINETYRIGVDVIFNDGSVSPTFYVDDIKIDTSPTNTANPTDNRRVANGGLPHYALNNNDSESSINVPYLVFSNIDIDFDFNGVPIKNAISTIRFRFAKIKKEVLASGFIIMGITGESVVNPVLFDGNTSIGMTIGPESNHHCQYLDWTGSYDVATISPAQNQNVRLNGTRTVYPGRYNAQRKTAFFYSPDISMGLLDDYELTAADKVNVLYPIRRTKINSIVDNYDQERFNVFGTLVSGPPTGDKMLPSLACEMSANPVSTTSQLSLENSNGVNQYDIEDAKIMSSGTSAIIDGVDVDTYHTETSGGNGRFVYESFEIAHSKCLAIRTDTDMFPFQYQYWDSEGVDYGVYYAQLFRETPNKYGNTETTDYQAFSQSYEVNDIESINTELSVFGGDSFIVKTLIRNRFARLDQDTEDNPSSGLDILDVGRQLGMTYFSQTSMNMELVYDNEAFFSYPEDFTGTYTNRWFRWTELSGGEYDQFYNTKYSYGLSQLVKNAFSESLNDLIQDVPTRVVYSSRDIYSSTYDSMKIFLPLSLYDFDGTFGDVEVVTNINGELFVIQPRKYSITSFNARGRLETSINSVDVLLKSGEVFSQDGQTLSSYGTQHKWSAIKGLSQSGKDVLYWFNQENGLIMRFGADGTGVLSSIRKMSMFFTEFTKWTKDKNEHAFEQGIRSVWDDKRKEAIWTFTAWRTIPEYVTPNPLITTQALAGTVLSNPNAPSDTFEGFPRFFRCTVSHVTAVDKEPGVGANWEDYWEQIAYTDTNYYSIFTIAYNELVSGFTTFYSHLPKTYLRWKNTFLSSHPTQRNLIYEHRRGLPTTWYERNGVSKQEDATIEGVLNYAPEDSKKFIAIRAITKNIPDRFEFRTSNQYSWLTDTDFVKEKRLWQSNIKQNTTSNTDNDPDSESLFDTYMFVKMFFAKGTYNLLYSMIIKIRATLRKNQD